MHTLTKFTWLFLVVISIAACKAKKAVSTSNADKLSANKLVDHMARHQVQAEWVEAKAKISFDGEDRSMSASATVVMRKDSLIWMSVRKLGFEVARAQIDEDSVYLINRLSNEYTIKGLEYLANAYNLPASLKTIQAILLGNPVFLNSREMKLIQDEESHHLVSASDQMENHFWLNKTNLSLVRALYGDTHNRREVDLLLEDYRPVNAEQNFSYLRQIKIDSRELGEAAIKIDFSKVEINNPRSVRFSIPSRYTRVD